MLVCLCGPDVKSGLYHTTNGATDAKTGDVIGNSQKSLSIYILIFWQFSNKNTMKKVITISSVLLGIVFLAGCGQQPVSQMQPRSTTLTADEVVSWQTYSNLKLGFEFKYPKDWKIVENENWINFQSAEATKWELENKNNCKKGVNCDTEFPPFDLILKYPTVQEFKKEIGNDSTGEEKVSIGGLDYIKYQIFGSMVASDNYRIEKNNRIYNFEIIGNEEISKKIIESFKFTK